MTDEVSNVNGGSSIIDSTTIVAQSSDVTSRLQGNVASESVVVTSSQTGNNGRNTCPHGNTLQTQPLVTTGWPPYGLPPGCTPPVGGTFGVNNVQLPQPQPEYSRDYNVGSTSNASNSMAAFRQHVEKSHHNLVNLLTQQMTTILNPMMADHGTKFEHLARKVERVAQIVDYDEGARQDVRGNHEGIENLLKNENDILVGKENPQMVHHGQNVDNLLNIHIPDLTHLAKRVCQVEILRKEKEKYKNDERKLKSKSFSRKERVSYVAMESSSEESELKKGSPYVCSLHKKILNTDKLSDSKHKSRKKYSFDILKSDQIFDLLAFLIILTLHWEISSPMFERFILEWVMGYWNS
ncbi:hypothetical protein Ahy_B03g063956 [Arachis hypogaea]|uniref:Uncharacterized protein n=1 Tax=Arachis hypogaea TaxID=3818 RepID=A0A444ZYH9_ARAHY|nr:hypothetical protein Ahy_B03g063956 [Arachis hypogaea]